MPRKMGMMEENLDYAIGGIKEISFLLTYFAALMPTVSRSQDRANQAISGGNNAKVSAGNLSGKPNFLRERMGL
jgi:hypothetical protein